MTRERIQPARRVVLYTRSDGLVGYKVQSGNWSTIAGTEPGEETADKSALLRRLRRRWPGVEIMDRTA